tara:strand:+ start:22311 stop:23264 length:954 start_codon:yes stop_codon:yes gene_type:complete
MGTTANYILNGPTLATSSTATLPPPSGGTAPDGYYSDGTIVRQLLGGVFVDNQDCDCTTACSNTVITRSPGVTASDYVDFSTGASVGAIIIRFTPGNIPVGVGLSMGNTSYNTWSSSVDGEHTRIAAGPFYLGNSANDFGLVSNSPWNGIIDRTYYDGTFTATGNESDISVITQQLSLTASSNPGELVAVIGKDIAAPSTVNVGLTCLNNTTGYTIAVECPYVIPDTYRFLSSSVQATPWSCGGTPIFPAANYLVSLSNPQTPTPQVGDFLFSNNLATSSMADGYYLINGPAGSSDQYTIALSNGVITSRFACPPPP